MSVTYDPTLATDLDWVRFQIGDKDLATAKLQNEEIEALLAQEPNKWLAASEAGVMLLARNRGVVSKSVDGLSISFGDSPEGAYRGHLKMLRERGCEELLKLSGSAVLRLL